MEKRSAYVPPPPRSYRPYIPYSGFRTWVARYVCWRKRASERKRANVVYNYHNLYVICCTSVSPAFLNNEQPHQLPLTEPLGAIFHRETCTQIQRRDLSSQFAYARERYTRRRVFTRKMCLNENKWAKHSLTRAHSAHIHAAEGKLKHICVLHYYFTFAKNNAVPLSVSRTANANLFKLWRIHIGTGGQEDSRSCRAEARQSYASSPQRCVHVDEHRTGQDDTDIFMSKSERTTSRPNDSVRMQMEPCKFNVFPFGKWICFVCKSANAKNGFSTNAMMMQMNMHETNDTFAREGVLAPNMKNNKRIWNRARRGRCDARTVISNPEDKHHCELAPVARSAFKSGLVRPPIKLHLPRIWHTAFSVCVFDARCDGNIEPHQIN